jgi:hypothetical protein
MAKRRIAAYLRKMDEWWSIEISDGEFSAAAWKDTHGRDLIRTALEHGATDWAWVERPWGVVLELCFPDRPASSPIWEIFRGSPIVKAALDAVPDPVNGLILYPGRGGSSGAPVPRRPRPAPTTAAVALPEPEAWPDVAELVATAPPPGERYPAASAFGWR